MKKILLLMILLITMLSVNAETHYYKANYYNIRSINGSWKGWTESNVYITIDTDTRHVEIDSNTPQIIDYTALSQKSGSGYTLYVADATDRKYTPMRISFQIFTNGLFYLTITYSDVEYSYSIYEVDPD